ncbi:MAG: MFS transporter, partial [Euryarchaeota archaeon]|nr:MFS transporter [Euryarchaeota archaeon]
MTVEVFETDRLAKRNVAVLFYAQAILGSQQSINIILGGLAGFALAGNKALATLPISVMLLASMLSTGPISLFMGRYGRKAGFLIGATSGLMGGVCSAGALYVGRFDLLLVGAAFTGIFRSTHGYFRFAAADTASEEFKPKAISLVLAGGLVSALIGPELVRQTTFLIDSTPYAGAYLAVVVINVLGALGILFLDIPTPPRKEKGEKSGRDMKEIFSQKKTIVAVICAMVSYSLMTLVMTSTTLAMTSFGFTTALAADVVRWHIVAMFA